jgi:hypothetical protein
LALPPIIVENGPPLDGSAPGSRNRLTRGLKTLQAHDRPAPAHKELVLNELDRWLLLMDATHDPAAAGRQH